MSSIPCIDPAGCRRGRCDNLVLVQERIRGQHLPADRFKRRKPKTRFLVLQQAVVAEYRRTADDIQRIPDVLCDQIAGDRVRADGFSFHDDDAVTVRVEPIRADDRIAGVADDDPAGAVVIDFVLSNQTVFALLDADSEVPACANSIVRDREPRAVHINGRAVRVFKSVAFEPRLKVEDDDGLIVADETVPENIHASELCSQERSGGHAPDRGAAMAYEPVVPELDRRAGGSKLDSNCVSLKGRSFNDEIRGAVDLVDSDTAVSHRDVL